MPLPINISASRGAAILGLSGYMTQIDIWLQIMESREPGFCEKHGYEKPVFEYNSAMKWGHAFESAIINLAENVSGDKIINREKAYMHPEYNFITCHQDGEYENKKICHEGKTTSQHFFKDNFGKPGTDKVPWDYQVQCQNETLCTGAEKVILSVLVFPRRVEEWEEMGWKIMEASIYGNVYNLYKEKNKPEYIKPYKWAEILNEQGYFHQYTINANPEIHKKLILEYSHFWQEHVLTGTPPQPKTIDDIKKLFREPVGTIIATDEIERYYSEEKQINDELRDLNNRKEQLKLLQLNFLQENSKIKNFVVDDESQEKIVLRDIAGKKMHSYYKDKNGNLVFR